MISENIGENRIRPDDTMIGVPAVRRIFGNVAVSTVYDDADLMALKIIVSGRARSRPRQPPKAKRRSAGTGSAFRISMSR